MNTMRNVAASVPSSGSRRVALTVLTTMALIVPLAYVFIQFWAETTEHLNTTEEERQGVRYARPLITLIGELTTAQSAAVRGQDVDSGAMQAAVAAVDAVDRQVGGDLRTEERWKTLRQRALYFANQKPGTGEVAFAEFTDTTRLALDLLAKISDTSALGLDPQLDNSYIVDTTVARLPSILVDSGQLADLAYLDSFKPASDRTRNDNVVFAARDRVASAVNAVNVGLRKSFDSTESDTLGPNLLGPADVFINAAHDLAPTSTLLDQRALALDPENLAKAQARTHQTAIQLGEASLTELDSLLADRERSLTRHRSAALVALLIGILLGGLGLWLRLPRRDTVTEEGEEHLPPPPRHAAPVSAASPGDEDLLLKDARELLGTSVITRAGRAIRPTRQEQE